MQVGRRTKPFQYSTVTSRNATEVLEGLKLRPIPGIGIDEEGTSYLIFMSKRRYRYSTDVAVALGVLILLAILALSAWFVPILYFLWLALVPAIPLRFDHSAMVAVSAVENPDAPGTRITAHGEATVELSATLDAYFASLPPADSHPAEAPHDHAAKTADQHEDASGPADAPDGATSPSKPD